MELELVNGKKKKKLVGFELELSCAYGILKLKIKN